MHCIGRMGYEWELDDFPRCIVMKHSQEVIAVGGAKRMELRRLKRLSLLGIEAPCKSVPCSNQICLNFNSPTCFCGSSVLVL